MNVTGISARCRYAVITTVDRFTISQRRRRVDMERLPRRTDRQSRRAGSLNLHPRKIFSKRDIKIIRNRLKLPHFYSRNVFRVARVKIVWMKSIKIDS